jgi:anti-sigma B factor antagonist
MTPNKITCTTRVVSKNVAVIDISGEINAAAENALMDAYTQANNARVRSVVLNFSGLEYMNSSGIGLLVTLLIRIQRQGQKLLAYGLTDHYRQIFELTRLNEAIALFASETEALTAAT